MSPGDNRVRWLKIATAAAGVALAVQSARLLFPVVTDESAPKPDVQTSFAPAFDYQSWRGLPVQMGRTKPFETACSELVREITGRTRFEKQDPIAIVLAWMLTGGKGAAGHVDWESYTFILCEHADLRHEVFAHKNDPPAGRHVSPSDLRQSPGFDRLLEAVAKARAEHQAKAHLFVGTAELKAEEVGRRLARYDAICGRAVTRLHANAIIGDQFLNLQEFGVNDAASAEQTVARMSERQPRDHGPLRLVALDRSPGAGWFSIEQLRSLVKDPKRWNALLQERSSRQYLGQVELDEMRQLQERVRSGGVEELLSDLPREMARRRDERIAEFESAHKTKSNAEGQRLFGQIVRTPADHERIKRASDKARQAKADAAALQQAIVAEMRAILADADDQTIKRVRGGLEHIRSNGSRDDDPEFRPVLLDYLEARKPDLYRRSAAALEFPEDDAVKVLDSFNRLRDAYASADSGRFETASQDFMARLSAAAAGAGQPYPGIETIPLELTFNRVQPFRWAWVAMLLAAAAFAIRLGLGSRIAYAGGFILAAVSLAFQAFGFYCRVSISGWAPVSNLYETIIFAAFMAGAFSLALEAIYRKTVIVLTGTLVATLGLILADNLPLDSGIGGLVPVLRSNFWLTVHVLTIICGYAAGILAWGIGNVTLGLLAFGRGDRDTLKLLSQFTYRGLQLTVLLLATGTFLGGWWAADAWGRFWGWDPKEVGALVALVCYVIPLHARYIGWVREFGLAVSAVLCFGSILISWYVINFVLAAGLHSYGFGGGGGPWVLWAVMLNVAYVLATALVYHRKKLGHSAS
jgi:ABC-type transport system involved in cytochrome c biogenesis permease subunit